MSGLEPIAALGLACNILQVIAIGRETVQVALQVYRAGELDPALAKNAGVLEKLSREILTSRSAASIRTAFKRLWKKPRLEKLDQKLRAAETFLQTGNVQLDDLVKKRVTGEIKSNAHDIKYHVTQIATQAEDSINGHIRQARKEETQRY
ncbi:hypothetical protein PspLS_01869 [Pyricularia sp. CBS 133598]|nr:hypothetical protein PspLS_01869 [Pyricularia sp. CBS 133598]